MDTNRNYSDFSSFAELLQLQGVVGNMDFEKQRKYLIKKKLECLGLLLSDSNKTKPEGLYCDRTWDNAICWPPTKAGTTAYLPCPEYVSGLNAEKNATRECMEDGTWYYNPEANNTWTNYSACLEGADQEPVTTVPRIIKEHLVYMRLMCNIGYGLSMTSLVTAVIIMLYFKKLRCPRNTIHLNLFMSFILRAAVSFVKENLLVEGLGFAIDVYYEGNKILFKKEGMHWECRLFFTIFNYILAASYTWIFVEALYLQILISLAVFSERSRTNWYILFGWVVPLTFTIPWVCLRISDIGNEYCWNTYYKAPWLLWVINGPITASIIVNFLIFINIVRILFTKLNASPCPETNSIFRYRRLAKSTLILIPLFGVYYIVFAITTIGVIKGDYALLVLMYAELFFNSFQGFLLSLLFCFFNAEVQNEIKKAWKRHMLRRTESKSFRTYSHSRFTRHRHSEVNGDIQHGDIKEECEIETKETIFSGCADTDPCIEQINGFVQETNLHEVREQTPCLNKNRIEDSYSNTDTIECGDVQTSCNNNHTCVSDVMHTKNDIIHYNHDVTHTKNEGCVER